jgi:hypothetical protein
MKVQFVSRDNGPERLVCEAEVVFGEGPLEGMKLVGFSLWKDAEGEVYVTFPSRAFGAGSERRYFDYLRAVDTENGGVAAKARGVKAWILEEYRSSLRPLAGLHGHKANEPCTSECGTRGSLQALAQKATRGKR